MKFSRLITFIIPVMCSPSVLAWGRSRTTALKQRESGDLPSHSNSLIGINSQLLLEERQHKPSFYTDVMLELKRLEERPLCYRTAAQLLMSNCQGLEDIRKDKYEAASASIHRHYVESFAAGLTMCDMERAQFDIPRACAPFRSGALDSAIRGSGKVDVTPQQISECLQGLGRDHSHWSTWLSYRDTALLLCRGASLEVDKDNLINFQKELVRQMEQFTTGLYDDLRELRERMATHANNMESTFEKARKQAEAWKHDVNDAFGAVSEGIKEANFAVKSVVGGTNDAFRMIKNLVTTLIQTNAEIAAHQEHALEVTTETFKSGMGDVNDLVGKAEVGLVGVQGQIGSLAAFVTAIAERQILMEQSSIRTTDALLNATELLQNHASQLQKASESADNIREQLEKASTEATTLSTQRFDLLHWTIRGFCPFITLYGGNFGTTASIKTNLGLVFLGLGLAETIIFIRTSDLTVPNMPWTSDTSTSDSRLIPLSFTHRGVVWNQHASDAEDGYLPPTITSDFAHSAHL